MPLTRPIPDVAQPIANYLRKETKPPPSPTSHTRQLPVPIGGKPMRDRSKVHRPLRWWIEGAPTCPIGLHPMAEKRDTDNPDSADGVLVRVFPTNWNGTDAEIDAVDNQRHDAFYAFMEWWDEQTDAKAAVAAIWD